ncbi:hypothetical protein N7463_007625 [Penicillium fimorum]|uniref:Uncharacterized protein n=1 Tax=Penicillium fimorum TaxID=1882269 RepID=A0A9W9XXZ5_9EURO|nr:hypothetical protein N7463_007625 [Penicillium fimorum]
MRTYLLLTFLAALALAAPTSTKNTAVVKSAIVAREDKGAKLNKGYIKGNDTSVKVADGF